jgi:hypothetical protein
MVQQVRMRTSWLNDTTGEHGRECMNGTTGGCIEQQVWGGSKGRERNPPPCSRHLGQVVYGCVTLWRQRVAQLIIPPPLLASWEIAGRLPNQTIGPTRDC